MKQGAVLRAILYCVYCNGLFLLLKKKKIGCWINTEFVGMVGYADDNFLLSPSQDGLQEMLKTCDEYASQHNLKFSTNPDPKKSKTKCLSFLLKERDLAKMKLCNDDLPWVESGKHLGNKVENRINGLKKDILEKRARYIGKNNEIIQEFYFAHPKTKLELNTIYNSHYTGSNLWDLFSREFDMICNTYSLSIKLMYNLPRSTHNYIIEPITESQHVKFIMMKRFVKFTEKIRQSNKVALRSLYRAIRKNTLSVTGSNLRNIMILTGRASIDSLLPSDLDNIAFSPVPANEEYRISFLRELIDLKNGDCVVPGFTVDEYNEIICHLCNA